uniref:Uncharacterized protein n=1 Tax=Ciona intestinalis TaxID=7719 RepID=H2XQ53_CIOIN
MQPQFSFVAVFVMFAWKTNDYKIGEKITEYIFKFSFINCYFN